MRTVATKTDNELAERFSKYCEGKGCTPSEELRSMIKEKLGAPQAGTPTTTSASPPGRKFHPGYCRGYHIDPETGMKILSRPARVATDAEIRSMML